MSYWPQVPGECEERISDSVAPEHLRGACGREVRPRYRGTGPTGLSRRRAGASSHGAVTVSSARASKPEMAQADAKQCM